MTTLDWIIVGFAAFTAFGGYRRGLVGTVLSFAGLVSRRGRRRTGGARTSSPTGPRRTTPL